jgi:hypothetical protein
VNIFGRDELSSAGLDPRNSALDLAVSGGVCLGLGFTAQQVQQFFRQTRTISDRQGLRAG